jgi:hypothetical protein
MCTEKKEEGFEVLVKVRGSICLSVGVENVVLRHEKKVFVGKLCNFAEIHMRTSYVP